MPELRRKEVFVSYSHADKKWLAEVHTHLRPLVRESKITVWEDTKIKPGGEWRVEIQNAIDRAKIALLLVSPQFLASDFIAENELPPLLEAAGSEGVKIFWVPLRKSSYKRTPIDRYQAAADPSRPLANLKKPERDAELVRICEEIASVMGQPFNAHETPEFEIAEKQSPERATAFAIRTKEVDSTVPSIDETLFLPKEYYQSLQERYLRLSQKQNRLLMFIAKQAFRGPGGRGEIRQDTIEKRLRGLTKAEVFYRLEHLRLLGFLEKRGVYDHDNRYRLSELCQSQLGLILVRPRKSVHVANSPKAPNRVVRGRPKRRLKRDTE